MNKEQTKAKTQTMRISDTELEMLKSTFSDRDELLKTIRNLFLGLSLIDEEKKEIKRTFSSESLRKLMRKQFLPEIQGDLPIGQCIDLWMTIDLKDKDEGQILQIIESRKKLVSMIEIALKLLEDIDGEVVKVHEWVSTTGLIARNQFISHIDQQLMVIKTLAGVKSETVEETKKRLLQNSSK